MLIVKRASLSVSSDESVPPTPISAHVTLSLLALWLTRVQPAEAAPLAA